MFRKNLKTDILLFPILSLVLSFFIILFIFNFSVQKYISNISEQSSASEFYFFDYYYGSNYENPVKKNGEFLLFSKSLIFDENLEEVLPPQTKTFNKEISNKVRDMLKQRKSFFRNKEFKLTLPNQTYYVIYKHYFGTSDGFSIEQTSNPDMGETYTVAVVTNITYIQNFIIKIRFTLLVLMFFSGTLTILLILRIGFKIDKAFSDLKRYILNIGKRIKIQKPKKLYYSEFNEVINSVFQMSKLIDKTEESQKYFFQNASHELKTPLMSIQGYAEGIKTGVISDVNSATSIIIKESKKMSNLVNEILMLSKLNSNYDNWELSEFDLKDLIYTCFYSIKTEAKKREIGITIDFAEETILINGNEALLEKAVINIISNALRYAKTYIHISCCMENNYKKISIRDDGKGIEKEMLPHIFERFYKGNDGNTGIGLAITKEVVNKYNGHIEVISGESGTEFIIYLP